jgi:hypothetical protein
MNQRSYAESAEMENWKAVDEVMEMSNSAGASRLILISIARHINRRTGEAWPGTDQLAYLANCHEDHVRKCLRTLEDLGELEVEIQGGPGTSKADKPNLYRIPFLTRGVNSPAEQKDVRECVEKDVSKRGEGSRKSGTHTQSKAVSSAGESPPHLAITPKGMASLKESGIYDLVPEGVRDMLFRDLPPQEPEVFLLRTLLVQRTGESPPPGWKAGITRSEAVARLEEMFGEEHVAC